MRIQHLVSRPVYPAVRGLASQVREAIKAESTARKGEVPCAHLQPTQVGWELWEWAETPQPEEEEVSAEETSPVTRGLSVFRVHCAIALQ